MSKRDSKRKETYIQDAKDRDRALLKEGKFAKLGLTPHWIKNGEDRFLIDETRAVYVRRIFDLYNKGHSTYDIAKIFNAEGVPSPHSHYEYKDTTRRKFWDRNVIVRILKCKSVIGFANQFTEDVRLYPSIIDEGLFYSVQHKLNERRLYKGRVEVRLVNLFKKLMKCKHCGGFMTHFSRKYNRSLYSYICKGMNQGVCNRKGVSGNRLEKSFQYLLCQTAHRDKILQLVNEERIDLSKSSALKGQLADIKIKINHTADLIVNNTSEDTPKTLLKKLKDLETEERRLNQEISIEEATIRSHRPVSTSIQDLEKFVGQWSKPEIRLQLREHIRNIVEKIVVDKNEKSYEVWFKTAKQPIKVLLEKKHFVISQLLCETDDKGNRIKGEVIIASANYDANLTLLKAPFRETSLSEFKGLCV